MVRVVFSCGHNIRFSRHSCEGHSSDASEQVNHETEHWPVTADLQKELDALKYDFCAVPLRVYVNDRFVEPLDVNNTIRGALVEVHFELRHYFIAAESYDSFNVTIEQILVLQPGAAPPDTPYKRKNVRDGPIRLKPSPAEQRCDQKSTSDGSHNEGSPSEKDDDDCEGKNSGGEHCSFVFTHVFTFSY